MVSFHSSGIYSPFSDLGSLLIITTRIILGLGHREDEVYLVTDVIMLSVLSCWLLLHPAAPLRPFGPARDATSLNTLKASCMDVSVIPKECRPGSQDRIPVAQKEF